MTIEFNLFQQKDKEQTIVNITLYNDNLIQSIFLYHLEDEGKTKSSTLH